MASGIIVRATVLVALALWVALTWPVSAVGGFTAIAGARAPGLWTVGQILCQCFRGSLHFLELQGIHCTVLWIAFVVRGKGCLHITSRSSGKSTAHQLNPEKRKEATARHHDQIRWKWMKDESAFLTPVWVKIRLQHSTSQWQRQVLKMNSTSWSSFATQVENCWVEHVLSSLGQQLLHYSHQPTAMHHDTMRVRPLRAGRKSHSLGWSKWLAPANFLQHAAMRRLRVIWKNHSWTAQKNCIKIQKLALRWRKSTPLHIGPWHRWHCVHRRLYSSSFWRKFSICSITTSDYKTIGRTGFFECANLPKDIQSYTRPKQQKVPKGA